MIYDLEPRQFIYNRTGNLATVTEANEKIATEFMRVSDLRRDIVIVDSGKKPKANTVAVKSDTLAFRAVASISELTKVVMKPKQFHEIEIVDNQYIVSIHDQIIDDDIRKKKYQDKEDYDRQFLCRLKGEVNNATAEVLFAEKLGFSDQKINYKIYNLYIAATLGLLASKNYLAVSIFLGSLFWIMNPLLNMTCNKRFQEIKTLDEEYAFLTPRSKPFMPPDINPREWKKAFYPLVPIDKWAKGKKFLWQHGNELISEVNPAGKVDK